MPKRPSKTRPVATTPRAKHRLPEIPEVVGKAPPPKPAEPEPKVGAGMTEADILELVNNSYN